MLLRFAIRCIGKFSVYLLKIKIQITDIFDFYLLPQNQDLLIFSVTHLKNLRMHVRALTRAHIMIVHMYSCMQR